VPPERDETTSLPEGGDADGPLDAALRGARWPEPSSQAVARLQDAVLAEGRRYRRGRMVRLYMGAAGAIAAAAAMIVVAVRVRVPAPSPKLTPDRTVAATGPSSPTTGSTVPVLVMWRPANLYERAVVQANLPRPSRSQGQAATARRREVASTRRVSTSRPATQPAPATADRLRLQMTSVQAGERAGAEAALIARASSSSQDAEGRIEAVSLLADYGSRRALPALSRAADEPALAPAATRGIARLAGANAVALRARAAKDPAIRRAAYAALAASAGREGGTMYLSFVLNAATREEALAALDAVPAAQATASLVEQLANPRVDYRLAAARALARACSGGGATGHDAAHHDPVAEAGGAAPSAVARVLQGLLDQNICRREVLAALLQCRDANARRYIASLRTDRSIDSELRALERELADLFG
jgi:hypothetical protein